MKLNKEQQQALKEIKIWAEGSGPNLISLTGYAGTGKSTLISHAKEFINNVQYCALTGRAAFRLSKVAGVSAKTLHSVLYKGPEILKGGVLEFNKLAIPNFKYLVVDEASVLSPKLFNDLKHWIHMYGTRILFIGDSFQLPPVLTPKEEKEYREFSVFSYVKGPQLKTVMRSNDEIIENATIVRNDKKIPIKTSNSYSVIEVSDPIAVAIQKYLADPTDHIILTWRNKMRMEANHQLRKKLGYTSFLPDEGEPVIFCRNGQGVLNGEVATIKKIVAGPIIEGVITYRILLEDKRYVLCSVQGKDEFMDGQTPYIKNWKAYRRTLIENNYGEPIPITYGYVSTVHKFQGSQARRVSIMLGMNDLKSPYFGEMTTLPNKEKVPFGIRYFYTGITRAEQQVEIIIGV